MTTERQEREYEQLKSFEDYTELIKELDDLASSVSNGEIIDKEIFKSIACVSKAMRQKVKYIVDSSKSWRKKQSWLSVRRDKKIEKEFEEQERQLDLMEQRFKNKQLPLPSMETKLTFWGKIKSFFCKNKQNKSLPSPMDLENEENNQKQQENNVLECAETDENTDDEEILDEKPDGEGAYVIEEDYMEFW